VPPLHLHPRRHDPYAFRAQSTNCKRINELFQRSHRTLFLLINARLTADNLVYGPLIEAPRRRPCLIIISNLILYIYSFVIIVKLLRYDILTYLYSCYN
jgi:hypothetical protein